MTSSRTVATVSALSNNAKSSGFGKPTISASRLPASGGPEADIQRKKCIFDRAAVLVQQPDAVDRSLEAHGRGELDIDLQLILGKLGCRRVHLHDARRRVRFRRRHADGPDD